MGFAKLAEHVHEQFEHPVPAIRDIQEVPDDSFFWKIEDCRSKHWIKGRIVLLGDAATGFLPTAGVGASMAMESAAALSDELSRTNPERVEQALKLFEKRHRQRIEKAQDSSRRLGQMMFVESRPVDWVRDKLVQFYTVEQLIQSIADLMDEPI